MNNYFNFSSKINLTFAYFAVIALLGLYLRAEFVFPFQLLNFKNILHAHSHFAMLGWIYNLLFIAILFIYSDKIINFKKYNILFWITQFISLGLLFAFTIQGYKVFSIVFSVLHIFISYIFAGFIYADLKNEFISSLSIKFIFAGLFFLILSSLAPWGLTFVVILKLSNNDLYNQLIYFYLHFQYNGWFIFTFLGLWLKYLEPYINSDLFRFPNKLFYTLFFSNIAAFSLSLLGFDYHYLLNIFAFIISAVQLIAFFKLFNFLNLSLKYAEFSNSNAKFLFRFSLIALFTKFLLQLISALPKINLPAFIARDVVIGYLHLIMLGVLSFGMIAFLMTNELIPINKNLISGIHLFLFAFIITELYLFYPALKLWFNLNSVPLFTEINFFMAVLMFIASIFILISVKYKNSNSV